MRRFKHKTIAALLNQPTTSSRGSGALRRAASLVAAIAVATGSFSASANDAFPTRPLTIIVPFAPGGSLDLTARVIAERMKDVLQQPVLVTNRPGAGSVVAVRALSTAPADGHTMYISSGSGFGLAHLLVPGFTKTIDDFSAVARVATNNSLVLVNAKVPASTLAELIEYSRKKPGGVSFCSSGASGLNHLQLEMIKSLAAARKPSAPFDVTHVPYNGLAPALIGLRSGDVDACALPYAATVKNMHGKELRIVAVQTGKRLPQIPDVQTTGEQGYPEMDENSSPVVVMVLKGTPPDVIRKLEAAFKETMADPEVLRRLDEAELQPGFVGAAETDRVLKADVVKFSKIIRDAKLDIPQ